MDNYSPIKRLAANTNGKDYVIGDLHGCLHLLKPLLDSVGFNSQQDRLFSVGDMIDRGPFSLECLALLSEPWFYAVKGNHEWMMIDFFYDYLRTGTLDSLSDTRNSGFLEFGGKWVIEYFDADQACMTPEFDHYLQMVINLPVMRVVGDNNERFHVVHAELIRPDYRSYRDKSPLVWLDADIDQWLLNNDIPAEVQDRLYWSRIIMNAQTNKAFLKKTHDKLSRTFCGHTIHPRVRHKLSHICLDTGAFVSLSEGDELAKFYGLTLFDVEDERWFTVLPGSQLITSGHLSDIKA